MIYLLVVPPEDLLGMIYCLSHDSSVAIAFRRQDGSVVQGSVVAYHPHLCSISILAN